MIRAFIVLGLAAYGTVKLAERFADKRRSESIGPNDPARPLANLAAREESNDVRESRLAGF